MPRLRGFSLHHPGIPFELATVGDDGDFEAQEPDIALQRGGPTARGRGRS